MISHHELLSLIGDIPSTETFVTIKRQQRVFLDLSFGNVIRIHSKMSLRHHCWYDLNGEHDAVCPHTSDVRHDGVGRVGSGYAKPCNEKEGALQKINDRQFVCVRAKVIGEVDPALPFL